MKLSTVLLALTATAIASPLAAPEAGHIGWAKTEPAHKRDAEARNSGWWKNPGVNHKREADAEARTSGWWKNPGVNHKRDAEARTSGWWKNPGTNHKREADAEARNSGWWKNPGKTTN